MPKYLIDFILKSLKSQKSHINQAVFAVIKKLLLRNKTSARGKKKTSQMKRMMCNINCHISKILLSSLWEAFSQPSLKLMSVWQALTYELFPFFRFFIHCQLGQQVAIQSKAFDTVSHNTLMGKLRKCGSDEGTGRCVQFRGCDQQSGIQLEPCSQCILQESVLAPLLLN